MRNRSLLFPLLLPILALTLRSGFAADTTPPTVTRLLPAAGSSVVQLKELEVFFSEDVLGVDPADLLINGVVATDLNQVSASQYRFTFPQPPTGTVQVAWASTHGITDLAVPANPFAGGSWTYTLNPALALHDVRINEFLADNQTGIRDEDGTYQDWIELFNASTIEVNLDGCFLTDTKLKLDTWRFPATRLAPNSYLIVWASGKDRTNALAPLHTNFKLDPDGEYLAFLGPLTNVISAFDPTYPPQRPDVSYGRDPLDPSVLGYYSRPTPGAFNSVSNALTGTDFAPDVQFSQPGGTFISPFNLVLSTVSANAVIRYVLITNSAQALATITNVPSTNSPIYSGPIAIDRTSQIRARAFEPGKLPSTPISVTYIQISPNLVNFSSDLPLVLLTTFGSGSIQSSGDGTAYCMIFDNALDRTSLTNRPDTLSRIGLNDRGASTANQPKNNLALEFWDEFNQDTDRPFLDMPAQSDWVFYGIDGFDPSLMHNAIFYWFGRQLGRYSSRTRYVEVFRKVDNGPVTTNDYWGLYLVEEKPKRDKHRVDIETLQLENTNAPSVTGGYLLKIDRSDPDERTFQPPQIGTIRTTPIQIEILHPNVTPTTTDPRRLIQINYIQNYILNFITNLASATYTDPVNGYVQYIDVDSWVENHIANIICFNVDGYRLSGYFFKDRNKRIEQGPPWDCDRCLGTGGSVNTPQGDNRPFNPRIWRTYTTDVNSDQGTDFFGRSVVGVSWWDPLFRDPNFWQRWIDRYQALRTNEYSTNAVLAMVDGFYNEIKEAQVREQARWAPPPLGRQAFTWPRAGVQTVTTSAGGFSSSYTADFGPTNPASSSMKVGYFTNEVNFQKKWLLDRLDFLDTNFLAMPVLSLGTSMVTNGTVVTVQAAAKPNTVLYYTLDGTDPRLSGGAISPTALTSPGNFTLTISNNVRLFVRCYNPNHANLTNATLVGNPPINSFWSGPAAATYFTAVPPLRITEIMYHPAKPPAGNTNDEDNFEYLEVKNISSSPLNVNRFRLRGGVDFDFPNMVLAAGQAAVIVKNQAAFVSRYPGGPLILGSYTNNLGNDGDHLKLEGGFREPILDFSYDDQWYPITDGPGFSLQIVNENAPTDSWGLKESWRPSGVVNGTPGAADPGTTTLPTIYVNEALTHTEPLPDDAIELYNPTAASVNLSGWYLTDDFGTPKKYRIPNGRNIPANGYIVFYQSNSFGVGPDSFGLGAHGDELYLFSGDGAGNLTGWFHGFHFGAQALGATFGRHVISTGEDQFVTQISPTLGATNAGPKVGPIVISEINYHPPDFIFPRKSVDNQVDEYIELQNISSSPVPLYDTLNPANTWLLRHAVDYKFPTNVVIPAGGFLLVVGFTPTNGPILDAFRANNGVAPGTPIYGPWDGKLDNSADSIELARPDLPDPPGTSSAGFVAYILADKVEYQDSEPWPTGLADGFGGSITRVNPAGYGNDPANWRTSPKTPGAPLPAGGTPPVISVQPANTVGIETYDAMLSLTATGSAPLGYQWLFNDKPIPGGVNPVLTLHGLRLNQAGTYACYVYNSAGVLLSSNAALTVRMVARIVQQPADVRMRGSTNVADYGFATNNATFNVTATGTGTLRYQWRFNGTNIPNGTAATLVVPNVGLTNDGNYDVVITDDVAPITSSAARLTVLLSPVFLEPPLNQTVVSNGSFAASVVIRGNPPPFRYEWREVSNVRGTNLTSETTNYFSYGPVTNLAARTWRLVIFNDANLAPGALAPFNVTALADSDGDGIPDDWETAFGFNPASNADRNTDSDGDGMSNWAEYIAGTDPTNKLSNLRVDLTTLPGSALVQVGALSNHTYSVQYSDSLGSGVWLKLGDIVARLTNHTESLPDPGYTSNRFYRVVLPRQP